MSRSPGLSNLCKSRRLAPGAGVGGGPPPASPPPSQPPGSCLNTLKQSKSNYHAQAAREHLLHPPLGIANAPAQSADRRRAPRVSRVARCSCAMAPRHHPAAWHGEAAEPTFPALPAQLSLRAISRRIITPRSHTYGTSYLQNIYFNTCQGPPRVVGRASASRTGSWRGAFFLEERGVGRELGREHTGGGRSGLGTPPSSPGLPSALPTSLAAPMVLSQLSNSCLFCYLSWGPARKEKPQEVFRQRGFNTGPWRNRCWRTERAKGDTQDPERSPPESRKRLGLLEGGSLAEQGPMELGDRPRRRG